MQIWPDTAPINHCGHAILLHGAGAPVDTPWMNSAAAALNAARWWVWRAEFDYMSQRRNGLPKRPPPKVTHLVNELHTGLEQHSAQYEQNVLLVGKSMGGRVATLWLAEVAPDTNVYRKVMGALVLGYPFHPIGQPHKPRLNHLMHLQKPVEIIQGTRDAMGSKDWLATQSLSSLVTMYWRDGANHDLHIPQRLQTPDTLTLDEIIEGRATAWRQRLNCL